jgi:serine/threonine-protein kinase
LRLQIGSRLGAYEIVAPLGAGGMGEVYRAHDHRVARDVAIKVLPGHLATDAEARDRLEREAKAVAMLSHPNIVALYEFEQDGELAWVVTELLEGETLREVITRGPIPWRRAAEIGAAIADGLAAAHAKGIIHRDLKPENVLITTTGHVKLLDFGIAKSRPAAMPADHQAPTDRFYSEIFGTLGYMAPEQIRGAPAGPAADIFALGCVLYEAVSGRNPFSGKDLLEIMNATAHKEPPDLPAAVPEELDRLIRRCLAKHADARFQSAGDLAFALRSLGTKPESHETPPGAVRWRRGWIPLVVIAVALAAVMAWKAAHREASGGSGSRPVIRSLAVLPFTSSTDKTAEYLSDGITDSLIDDLSHVPDLAVVSRTSVFRYKGTDPLPQTVARDLNVQALLTVRVAQRGDALRISTELIEGGTNRHLWGQQYEARLAELAGVQAMIARQISEQLKPQLGGAPAVTARRTEDSEAYRLYLEGRYEWNKRTGEGFERAIHFFNEALARDPNYALAWAGLADSYTLQSVYYEVPPAKALILARSAAEHALALDERLAEAHTSLAYTLMSIDPNPGHAAREFERAIQLNPNYATARQWYSRCLLLMGRFDDAVRENRKAQALDPLSLVAIADGAGLYSDTGRYDDAIALCQRALDIEPNFALAHFVLAGTYLRMGRYDDAAREADFAWRLAKNPRSLARAGVAYAKAGHMDDARRTLAELEQLARKRYVPSYALAALMIAVGRNDDAVAALRRAMTEMPAAQYRRLLVEDPVLLDVRNDPRFLALART